MAYLQENYTKTSNWWVKDVYYYILQYQYNDSEYWSTGGGSIEIIKRLEKFNSITWKALEEDVHNWTSIQLEILVTALVEGKDYDWSSIILFERSCSFTYILVITDNSIAYYLVDYFLFIAQGGPKRLALLEQLQLKLNSLLLNANFHSYSFNGVRDNYQMILKTEMQRAKGE